jgi:hypothetical protein
MFPLRKVLRDSPCTWLRWKEWRRSGCEGTKAEGEVEAISNDLAITSWNSFYFIFFGRDWDKRSEDNFWGQDWDKRNEDIEGGEGK